MNADLAHMDRRSSAQLIRETFAHLPDPEQYAYVLPLKIADALIAAWASPSGRRVTAAGALALRPYGLCEFGGTHLTVFGTRVRNALLGDMLA